MRRRKTISDAEYEDEEQVLDSAERIMDHVDSCMDVAEVLLMEMAF